MKHKLSARVAAAVMIGALAFTVAACGATTRLGAAAAAVERATPETKAKVGVILPDTASSARWENADRKLLGEAFKAAGCGVGHPERQR